MARAFFNVSAKFQITFIACKIDFNTNFCKFRPLPDRTSGLDTESLIAEVWDFDPVEAIATKLSSFNDVKGMRGFRRLLKEITASALNESNLNELIGQCEISIPVSCEEFVAFFVQILYCLIV